MRPHLHRRGPAVAKAAILAGYGMFLMALFVLLIPAADTRTGWGPFGTGVALVAAIIVVGLAATAAYDHFDRKDG